MVGGETLLTTQPRYLFKFYIEIPYPKYAKPKIRYKSVFLLIVIVRNIHIEILLLLIL